jgi:hypothetical protein
VNTALKERARSPEVSTFNSRNATVQCTFLVAARDEQLLDERFAAARDGDELRAACQ